MAEDSCIFCNIVSGMTPADVAYDGGDTLFFRDISPKARVHILGVPKKHITSLATAAPDDQTLLGKLLRDSAKVAAEAGLAPGGYRVITNVGSDAGQDVNHIHFHILGGEPLGPLRAHDLANNNE